jgi:hypothetical protein
MSTQQASHRRADVWLVGLAIVVVALGVGRFADRFGLIVVLLVVFFAIIFAPVFLLVRGVWSVEARRARQRRQDILTYAAAHGFTVATGDWTFNDCGFFLFNQHGGFDNALTGSWNGVPLTYCEYRYTHSMGKSAVTFSYSCVILPLGMRIPAVSVASPSGRGGVGYSPSAQRVQLESIEFNERFEVDSINTAFAVELIDSRMIETLLGIDPHCSVVFGPEYLMVFKPQPHPDELGSVFDAALAVMPRIPQLVRAEAPVLAARDPLGQRTGPRPAAQRRMVNVWSFAAGLVALAGGVASNGLGQFGTSLGIQPAATAAPAAPTPQQGSLGTSFTETDDLGNTMSIALGPVIDPAHGTNEFDQPRTGNRLVATEFKLTGIRGSSADNANNDASLIDDNHHVYAADLDDVSECTNFTNGDYKVAPNQSTTGCVVFQVPIGVTVLQVKWIPEVGGATTIWDVP